MTLLRLHQLHQPALINSTCVLKFGDLRAGAHNSYDSFVGRADVPRLFSSTARWSGTVDGLGNRMYDHYQQSFEKPYSNAFFNTYPINAGKNADGRYAEKATTVYNLRVEQQAIRTILGGDQTGMTRIWLGRFEQPTNSNYVAFFEFDMSEARFEDLVGNCGGGLSLRLRRVGNNPPDDAVDRNLESDFFVKISVVGAYDSWGHNDPDLGQRLAARGRTRGRERGFYHEEKQLQHLPV